MPLRQFLAGPGPRRLAAWVLGVSAFAALFATSFVGALHQPRPHDLPVAVVAPSLAVATLQERADAAVPGGFRLERYASVQRARASLRDGAVDAVWVPPSRRAEGSGGRKSPVAQLLTAAALGEVPTQVIVSAFTNIGKAAGAKVIVTDLVPLPAQDPSGSSSFFFGASVFLPTFLGSMVMALLLRRTPALATMAAILVLAGCIALIDVVVVDGGLGALAGHFMTLVGVAALTSLAFSAPTVAAGRLLGPVGALLAVLVFVVLGLPASGGPFGTAFLPGFQRTFSPGLPLTNAVDAVRNVSYFGGHEVGGRLAILAIWAGAGLLVLAVGASLEAKAGRTRPTPTLSLAPEAPTSVPLS